MHYHPPVTSVGEVDVGASCATPAEVDSRASPAKSARSAEPGHLLLVEKTKEKKQMWKRARARRRRTH